MDIQMGNHNDKVLNQNLNDIAPDQQLLIAQLLFTEKPQQASPEKLQAALEKFVGTVNNISENPEQPSYAVEKFKAEFKDSVPIPVLASFVGPYDFAAELDELTSSQFWDVKNGTELMNACKYSVSAFSMLSGGLHYKQQAELFLAQIEAALECYPDCKAIYVPHSGKLTLPSYFYEGRQYGMTQNFIRTAVNARFFRISNSEDMVVDTLGFYAFGAADVQVHFHGMEPGHVVEYVYNIADYLFQSEFVVKSGDTIDGIDRDGRIQPYIEWHAQYEDALIQPVRTVLDINCGKFAAGTREDVWSEFMDPFGMGKK